MTKKELVELLNANYADDETVAIKYWDDQGECFEDIGEVGKEEEHRYEHGHWERLDDGVWRECKYLDVWKCDDAHRRFVKDRDVVVKYKCIVVK